MKRFRIKVFKFLAWLAVAAVLARLATSHFSWGNRPVRVSWGDGQVALSAFKAMMVVSFLGIWMARVQVRLMLNEWARRRFLGK
jgi:hypothetical protein